MNRRMAIWLASGLLVITGIAMFPSLGNGFTNWDDWHLVLMNEDVAECSVGKIFSNYYVGTYIPLTILSFTIDYHIWNLDPFWCHFTNYLLHGVNCLLLAWLIFKLTDRPWLAWVTALLFAIHPLRVESVAWLSGRKDVLYGLFFLGSIISYLYYRERSNRHFYCGALILFIMSLLSKGLAVTLPIVLILCDYLTGRRFDRKAILEKLPFFAVAGLFALVAFLAQGTGEGWGPGHAKLSVDNLLVGCYTLVFYLGKIIAPLGLCALYPHPANIAAPYSHAFWGSAVFVILTAVFLVRSRLYTRKLIFGSAFFFLTLLPVLQFFPVGGQAIAADRYTYIPFIGLAYIGAELFFYAAGRLRRIPRRVLTAALVMLFVAYGVLSWQRCTVWKSSISLWTNVIDKHPDVSMAWFNRGQAFGGRGKTERALKDYTRAIELNHDEAANNRGLLFHNRGDYEMALADYNAAIARKPDFADAFFNRGNTRLAMLQYELAETDYNRAIEIHPEHVGARLNRGTLYSGLEEYGKAIEDFTQVLETKPDDRVALYNRAVCNHKLGNSELAGVDLLRLQALGYLPVTPQGPSLP